MDASPEIFGWLNRQLASRNRPTLTELPDGGLRAALPDYRFFKDLTFSVLAFPGLVTGPVPKSVYRALLQDHGPVALGLPSAA